MLAGQLKPIGTSTLLCALLGMRSAAELTSKEQLHHCDQLCFAQRMHLTRGPRTWRSARACALQALGGCASTATALATSAARAVSILKFSSWHQGNASPGCLSPLNTPPADEAALLMYGSGHGGRWESPCRVQMWWAGRE